MTGVSPTGFEAIDEKGNALLAVFAAAAPADARIGVAFSGGVDSRFAAWAARRAGLRPLLLHVSGIHVPSWEVLAAKRFAFQEDMPWLDDRMPDDMLAAFAAAGRERCYVCKREMMTIVKRMAADAGIRLIVDGTNADDAKVWRPGSRAVREAGVFSPLKEAGLTKADVRALARRWEMPDADQPARPCLMTRFPYGLIPSVQELKQVAAAESALEPLAPLGLRYRVRMLPDGLTVHVEKGAAPGILEEARLRTGLPVVEIEELSGWFDRREEEAAARRAGLG